jgi:hypothetical protein
METGVIVHQIEIWADCTCKQHIADFHPCVGGLSQSTRLRGLTPNPIWRATPNRLCLAISPHMPSTIVWLFCEQYWCNVVFWPRLKIDPGFIFQRWILNLGCFVFVEDWDQKFWNICPGSFFNGFAHLFWNWPCWIPTPTTVLKPPKISWKSLITYFKTKVFSIHCKELEYLGFFPKLYFANRELNWINTHSLFKTPVRIWVRLGLVCRERRLKSVKTEVPCHSRCSTTKIPLIKGPECRA